MRIQCFSDAMAESVGAQEVVLHSRDRADRWEHNMQKLNWSIRIAEQNMGSRPKRYTNILKVQDERGSHVMRALTSTAFGLHTKWSHKQYALIAPKPENNRENELLAVDTNSAKLAYLQKEYAERGHETEILWWRSYGEMPIHKIFKNEYMVEREWWK